MSTIDELVPLLKKLRLSGVLQSLELRLQQAREDSLPYEEFVFRLLSDEVERRDGKQLEQRVRRANFERTTRRWKTSTSISTRTSRKHELSI